MKHTALGRFKHEGANVIVNRDGHVVAYMGDDERFDYLYRFVSRDTLPHRREPPGATARTTRPATLLSDGRPATVADGSPATALADGVSSTAPASGSR